MITQKEIDNATMHINGVNIADFGVLVESMKVGAIQTSTDVYQGVNRTNFNVLNSTQYMRPLSVNLFYSAPTRRELALTKSKLDNMMVGKLELWLPDGFYYSSYLESAGEETILGVEHNKVIALCAYQFKGIRHDKLEKVEANTVICKSTVPRTDCRLTCTASQAYASLQIDTVTITNVAKDDVLVVDGITGRILQNGGLCAGNMSFLHFPYLVPEENNLTCPEDLTVEYYPTY